MNILIFSLNLLWLPSLQEISAADTPSNQDVANTKDENQSAIFDPLVLLYDADVNLMTVADIMKIKNINFSQPYLRAPSQIIILCPAQSPLELEIQSQYEEHFHTIFFVQNSFSNTDAELNNPEKREKTAIIDEIVQIRCQNDFKPAIKYYHYYEIGFRIHTSDYLLTKILDSRAEPNNLYWYSFLDITTNKKTILRNHRTINHVIKAKMHSSNYIKCDDYTFGEEEWGELNLLPLYDRENQKKVFAQYQISKSFPNEYLVLHQLAPLQDNINTVTKPGFCTNINTVPVWQTIVDGPLRKVEQFVRKVADLIGYVAVETGYEGFLYSRTISQGIPTKVWLEIEENNDSDNIAIPAILSKKFTYTSKITDPPQNHYSITVYIHNEPTDQIESRKCDVSICSQNGWEFGIENEPKIGLTYCCFESVTASPLQVFDLNNVPILSKDGEIQEINVSKILIEDNPDRDILPHVVGTSYA